MPRGKNDKGHSNSNSKGKGSPSFQKKEVEEMNAAAATSPTSSSSVGGGSGSSANHKREAACTTTTTTTTTTNTCSINKKAKISPAISCNGSCPECQFPEERFDDSTFPTLVQIYYEMTASASALTLTLADKEEATKQKADWKQQEGKKLTKLGAKVEGNTAAKTQDIATSTTSTSQSETATPTREANEEEEDLKMAAIVNYENKENNTENSATSSNTNLTFPKDQEQEMDTFQLKKAARPAPAPEPEDTPEPGTIISQTNKVSRNGKKTLTTTATSTPTPSRRSPRSCAGATTTTLKNNNTKKKNKSSEPTFTDRTTNRQVKVEGELEGELSLVSWVQCNACQKWRRLRGGTHKTPPLPEQWFCFMNQQADPRRASCSVKEEIYLGPNKWNVQDIVTLTTTNTSEEALEEQEEDAQEERKDDYESARNGHDASPADANTNANANENEHHVAAVETTTSLTGHDNTNTDDKIHNNNGDNNTQDETMMEAPDDKAAAPQQEEEEGPGIPTVLEQQQEHIDANMWLCHNCTLRWHQSAKVWQQQQQHPQQQPQQQPKKIQLFDPLLPQIYPPSLFRLGNVPFSFMIQFISIKQKVAARHLAINNKKGNHNKKGNPNINIDNKHTINKKTKMKKGAFEKLNATNSKGVFQYFVPNKSATVGDWKDSKQFENSPVERDALEKFALDHVCSTLPLGRNGYRMDPGVVMTKEGATPQTPHRDYRGYADLYANDNGGDNNSEDNDDTTTTTTKSSLLPISDTRDLQKVEAEFCPWVLHMPLVKEGMGLNYWPDAMRNSPPLRIHIPFGHFLVARVDAVHGGIFGNQGNIRLHIAFSPLAKAIVEHAHTYNASVAAAAGGGGGGCSGGGDNINNNAATRQRRQIPAQVIQKYKQLGAAEHGQDGRELDFLKEDHGDYFNAVSVHEYSATYPIAYNNSQEYASQLMEFNAMVWNDDVSDNMELY